MVAWPWAQPPTSYAAMIDQLREVQWVVLSLNPQCAFSRVPRYLRDCILLFNLLNGYTTYCFRDSRP